MTAYLNMAQQNIYVTLLHISQLMGIEETKDLSNRMYDFQILQELKMNKDSADGTNYCQKRTDTENHIPATSPLPLLEAFRRILVLLGISHGF